MWGKKRGRFWLDGISHRRLFLYNPDICLVKMSVEGIDLPNPPPFHENQGKSIVDADSAFPGEPDTFTVINTRLR